MDGVSKTVTQRKPVLPLGHYWVLCHRNEKSSPHVTHVIIGGSVWEMQLETPLSVILVTAIIGLWVNQMCTGMVLAKKPNQTKKTKTKWWPLSSYNQQSILKGKMWLDWKLIRLWLILDCDWILLDYSSCLRSCLWGEEWGTVPLCSILWEMAKWIVKHALWENVVQWTEGLEMMGNLTVKGKGLPEHQSQGPPHKGPPRALESVTTSQSLHCRHLRMIFILHLSAMLFLFLLYSTLT